MKVCIAEKPSVAREIAKILGAKTRKEGYLEGNGYWVTWTFGHFCTLWEPDDYTEDWKKWQMTSLPMLPEKFETKLKSDRGVKKQFGIIKKLLRKASLVINCGDAGQEGELIQRWVLREAKYRGPVKRLWISSLTAAAIREGFQKLQDGSRYDSLYHAGFSRAIGDWLLGMNATRLFTLKYGGYKQVLSVGRVQTPTLSLIVERQKEIETFVPTPFWELHTWYRGVDFHYEKGRFEKKTDGEKLLKQVEGQDLTIDSATKKKGKEAPPRLFDLTGLQVHCNKRLGFAAEQTLKIAQKLYEKKVITYPRVDTTYLPSDMYPKIPGILQNLKSYQSFTQSLLGKPIRKSAKVFNDSKVTDHHAIIPTGIEKRLPANEQNVFDAISRRFIAAFYPDCIVSKTTVIGEANGVRFKANGREILEPGWRVLYPHLDKPKKKAYDPDAKGKKDQEAQVMPKFEAGESGPHKPKLLEKMTQPPKYYTEATLLRAMETAGKTIDDEKLRDLMKANGLGRPSTRAAIIETLFRRKYIRRKGKSLHATDTGTQLIDLIQHDLLKSAELTGQWEKKLRDIESGSFSSGTFVKQMKEMVAKLITEVQQDQNTVKIAAPTRSYKPKKTTRRKKTTTTDKKSRKRPSKTKLKKERCPVCKKGKIIKGKSAYGCSEWKSGCDFRYPFQRILEKAEGKSLTWPLVQDIIHQK